MSSAVAQSISRFNLKHIYFLKELPTKVCASEKTYSSYMAIYDWKLISKFMKVKMWNISKCISCPYQIKSLSFPLTNSGWTTSNNVKWHWRVIGAVFAYFAYLDFWRKSWISPTYLLLRSQNVGNVSYCLRAVALFQSNQPLECCNSVNHFTDAVIFCL
jgi:hypothetical protein